MQNANNSESKATIFVWFLRWEFWFVKNKKQKQAKEKDLSGLLLLRN
jgi:hypothetical protein